MTSFSTLIKDMFSASTFTQHLHHGVDIFVGVVLLAAAAITYGLVSKRIHIPEEATAVLIYVLVGVLALSGLDHLVVVFLGETNPDPFSLEEWVAAGLSAVLVALILPWFISRFFVSQSAIKSLREGIEESRRAAQLAQSEKQALSQRFAESTDALRGSVERAYRLAALVENSRDAVIGVDEDGVIWQWNASAEELFMLSSLDMVGRSVDSIVVLPSGNLWREILRLSSPPFMKGFDEVSLLRGDGNVLPVSVSVSKVPSTPGSASGFVIVARDLSEKKKVEDKISAALAEKNLLLKEVHHRVKNNLQLICSLLRLQSKEALDEDALRLFRKSEDRIRSLALVHERLYRSENLSMFDFGGYVSDLVGQLVRSAENGGIVVGVEYHVEEILFPVDNAITCGLIVNELVANSLKHGDAPSIKLCVKLWREGATVNFSVWDDGKKPIAPNLFEHPTTLGLKLVRSLINQLGGTITVHQDGGTEFRVELPSSVLVSKEPPSLRGRAAA